MAGLKIKRLSLRQRLNFFHIKFTGYMHNAGPGTVEVTVAEALELDGLLKDFDSLLGKLEKLNELEKS